MVDQAIQIIVRQGDCLLNGRTVRTDRLQLSLG
jgi:hypothetical protein